MFLPLFLLVGIALLIGSFTLAALALPSRADVDDIAQAKAKEHGLKRLMNQTAIDMLQPGDVLVVDLFGNKADGTIVGDNLFYYVMQATRGAGLVVDGSVRELRVRSVRMHQGRPLLAFENIDDADSAQSLTGARLTIARADAALAREADAKRLAADAEAQAAAERERAAAAEAAAAAVKMEADSRVAAADARAAAPG